MSGPKLTEAELEERRKAELKKQIEERRRQIKEATDKYHEAENEIKNIRKSILRDRSDIVAMAKATPGIEWIADRIAEIKSEYAGKLFKLTERAHGTEAEDILRNAAAIRREAEALEAAYDKDEELAKCFDQIMEHFQKIRDHKEFEENATEIGKTKANQSTFIDINYELELNKISEKVSNDLKESAKEAINKLSEMLDSDCIAEKDAEAMRNHIKEITTAASEGDSALKISIGMYKGAMAGQESLEKRIRKFEELYKTYKADYALFINTKNAMRKRKIPVKPRRAKGFKSIEDLENYIQVQSEEITRINEQNEKRKLINEVMHKYDYKMCEDIVFHEDEAGSHLICQHESDGTAIHYHMDESEGIMIEVVGLEKEKTKKAQKVSAKRIENDKLDESEKEDLYSKQTEFCGIFTQMAEDLEESGLNLKVQTKNVPDKKHSKKIVMLESEEEYVPEAEEVVIRTGTGTKKTDVTTKQKERAIGKT